MSLALGTDYAHTKGRFTIVRIFENEVGFVWSKVHSRLEKMLPGRYFVKEVAHNYIGKAKVEIGKHVQTKLHYESSQESVKSMCSRLSVLHVAAGMVAFIEGPSGIFHLEENKEPYIIGEVFFFVTCYPLLLALN